MSHIDYYEIDSEHLILQFTSNLKAHRFSLGANLAYERQERLPEGIEYSILNTNEEFETVKIREYYLSLYLGFWQIHVGFRF